MKEPKQIPRLTKFWVHAQSRDEISKHVLLQWTTKENYPSNGLFRASARLLDQNVTWDEKLFDLVFFPNFFNREIVERHLTVWPEIRRS